MELCRQRLRVACQHDAANGFDRLLQRAEVPDVCGDFLLQLRVEYLATGRVFYFWREIQQATPDGLQLFFARGVGSAGKPFRSAQKVAQLLVGGKESLVFCSFHENSRGPLIIFRRPTTDLANSSF